MLIVLKCKKLRDDPAPTLTEAVPFPLVIIFLYLMVLLSDALSLSVLPAEFYSW